MLIDSGNQIPPLPDFLQLLLRNKLTELDLYPNLLAIRNFYGARDWDHVFITKVNEVLSSIKLEDKVLTMDGALVGRYRFISFEEAHTQFGNKPWFDILLKKEYQVLGSIHGFLNWEWYDGWPDNNHKLYSTRDWLYLSHGLLARSDNNQFYHAAIKHTYPLLQLTQKHGFESGQAFFNDAYNNGENEQYLQYLRSQAMSSLDENAIRYDPFWVYYASNNPLRLSIESDAGDLTFDFIGFDFKCRENKGLCRMLFDMN